MTQLIRQITSAPTRKVVAAGAGGAAVGAPLATLIAWVLSLYGVAMPAEVAAAVGGLISAVVAYVSAYMTREAA